MISVCSWQFDIKLLVDPNQLVHTVLLLLSKEIRVPPHSILLTFQGTPLIAHQTFHNQNLPEGARVQLKVKNGQKSCEHLSQLKLECEDEGCKCKCCIEQECIKKHFHSNKLVLQVRGQCTSRLPAAIFKVLLCDRIDRLFAVQSQINHISSRQFSNKIIKKLNKLLSLIKSLPQTSFEGLSVVKVKQKRRYLKLLNPYFKRNLQVPKESLLRRLQARGDRVLDIAFDRLFKIQYMLYEYIMLKSSFEKRIQQNYSQVKEYSKFLLSKVEGIVGNSPHSKEIKKRIDDLIRRDEIKNSQFSVRQTGKFTYRFEIRKEVYSCLESKIREHIKRMGSFGDRFTFSALPNRGGGELIRAELVFNSNKLNDSEIKAYIEYSQARQEISMILQAHELIRQEFEEVFNKFVQSDQYRRTVQFINEQLDFEKQVQEVSSLANLIDVVFCVDCTASMNAYVDQTKSIMRDVVLKYHQQHPKDHILFAFVAYRDHGDLKTTQTLPLEVFNQLSLKIDRISIVGGLDVCQAVIDGLDAVSKLDYREDSLRFVFHICDSPPHGKIFHQEEKDSVPDYDSYPQGCPCGLSYQTLRDEFQNLCINYCLMPVKQIPKTQTFLKNCFGSKVYTAVRLNKPKDLKREVIDFLLNKKELVIKLNKQLILKMRDSLQQIVKVLVVEIEQYFHYFNELEHVKDIEKLSKEIQEFNQTLSLQRQTVEQARPKESVIEMKKQFEQMLQRKKNRNLQKGLAILSKQMNQ